MFSQLLLPQHRQRTLPPAALVVPSAPLLEDELVSLVFAVILCSKVCSNRVLYSERPSGVWVYFEFAPLVCVSAFSIANGGSEVILYSNLCSMCSPQKIYGGHSA